MIPASLWLIVGAAVLWVGGEQFVLGATRLAERTRIPVILIGMFVAGFGTSAPEMTVSVLARARGEDAIALGNALGSNVANVLLVLPVATLATIWAVRAEVIRREVIGVLAATIAVIAVAADGTVARPEAAALVLLFVAVMVWIAVTAMRSPSRAVVEREVAAMAGSAPQRVATEAARTTVGLALIVFSADRLVWGASTIAAELGVSTAAIGLTVVAVGTSLPEVVTAAVAARHDEPDLVLGNVLGSNIFNALLVVGVAGLVGPLRIDGGAARAIPLVATALTALLLLAFLRHGYRLTRPQAFAWLGVYAAFTALLYLVQ